MDLKRIIKTIEAARKAGAPSLTLCLVGLTGRGKTARVQALAEELGRELIVLLPGTELPEEILGYPRPVRRGGGEVVRSLLREELERACRQPVVLLIDEMDKAREETHGALLTLLASRTVRGRRLHDDTIVICAMQPMAPELFLASQTGEALAARMIFIPVDGNEAIDHLEAKYPGLRFGQYLEPIPIPLPILPQPSPRGLDWAAQFAMTAISHGWEEEEIVEVVKGVLPPHIASDLVAQVADSSHLDVWELAAREGQLVEAVKAAPLLEVGERLEWIILTSWAAGCEALVRLLTETDVDTASRLVGDALERIAVKVDNAGGELEFDPSCSEERGVELLREAARRIEAAWLEEKARQEGGK